MNRRKMLSALGTVGAGLAARHVAARADGTPQGTASASPVAGPFAHLCGIHVAKKDPRIQIIAQHYCVDCREHHGHGGLFQCLLFDSHHPKARLLGVEYIISHEQYVELPPEEKKYWHPHAYEILAGGLIVPGMDPDEEINHFRGLLSTWGKTWHTWPDPKTKLPIGEPLLMWSLSGDGQADEQVIAQRDREFNVSARDLRERRGRALRVEVPQVSFPTSMDQPGRQWRDQGEDQPTPRK
jgi:hypothetical protein